jgi:hypothetical protein
MGNRDTLTSTVDRTVTVRPPENAAGATNWQDYAKSYGNESVATNMRQAYRMEFKQNQKLKQSQ